MATLNGKEVPQCVNCTQFKADAKERTFTKPTGDVKRVLCDDCSAKVNETYPVQEIRQPVKPEPEDAPPAAKSTPIIKSRGG